jgi:dTMP kinase
MKPASAVAPRRRGRFIVLEGIDGAGTTTQSRMLADWLRLIGRKALLTREPSDGPIGHLIRDILSGRMVVRDGQSAVRSRARPLDPGCVALLFAADRVDHLDAEVRPALARGVDVISDRYYHSSLAYQGQDFSQAWIRQINGLATAPDVTYLLDVPSRVGTRRWSGRSRRDLYEIASFQHRVERAYRSLPRVLSREAIVVLDGTLPPDEVLARIQKDLMQRFGWRVPVARR